MVFVQLYLDTSFVELFPNTAREFLQLKTNLAVDALVLYDAQGLEVHTYAGAQEKIDVSQLHAGIYFLRLVTPNEVQVLPFIRH